MMNKKGDLLNNVLSMLIAVIGIVLLAFAVVKLYGIAANQEEERAKNTLSIIEGKIDNLKEGETGKYPVQGVDGWFLTGWSGEDKERPDKCFLKSCICICPLNFDPMPIMGQEDKYYVKVRRETCQEKGFCRNINEEKLGVFDWEYFRPYIVFSKAMIELEISKRENGLSIIGKE